MIQRIGRQTTCSFRKNIGICSFSSAWKKTEPKEDARVTIPSGSPAHRDRGRTRRNSPACGGLRESPRLYRPRPRCTGLVTKGKPTQRRFRESFKMRRASSEERGGLINLATLHATPRHPVERRDLLANPGRYEKDSGRRGCVTIERRAFGSIRHAGEGRNLLPIQTVSQTRCRPPPA
jgi:hypothetical protein